jgi:hypothetical protein
MLSLLERLLVRRERVTLCSSMWSRLGRRWRSDVDEWSLASMLGRLPDIFNSKSAAGRETNKLDPFLFDPKQRYETANASTRSEVEPIRTFARNRFWQISRKVAFMSEEM